MTIKRLQWKTHQNTLFVLNVFLFPAYESGDEYIFVPRHIVIIFRSTPERLGKCFLVMDKNDVKYNLGSKMIENNRFVTNAASRAYVMLPAILMNPAYSLE